MPHLVMGTLRTIVLLLEWDESGPQFIEAPTRAWYDFNFFNPYFEWSMASYWAQQSNATIHLEGQVLDWIAVRDSLPDLMNRDAVANFAVATLESQGVNFLPYDMVIVIVAAPPGRDSDGGAASADSMFRHHAAVVARSTDAFDFFAHEIGHGLGLKHSFGNPNFKGIWWQEPGEYGHPYCVMSAQSYGGLAVPYSPNVSIPGGPPLTRRGPSVNGATALGRGWIDAHEYDLASMEPTEFTLRSRHWGGRNPQLARQAVKVVAGPDTTFVIEYREARGWDRGQDSGKVIVDHALGSTAEHKNPGTYSATFIHGISVPISLGRGALYDAPGFAIQFLDRSLAHHTITFKVFPGGQRPPTVPFELTPQLGKPKVTPLEAGETMFKPGETLCAEGIWPYRKLSLEQEWTVDIDYSLARAPLSYAWSIEGQPLTRPSGVLELNKNVSLATADLSMSTASKLVSVRYEIADSGTGSQLRLYNRPEDETYNVSVGVTLTTEVGLGTAETTVRFSGIEYRYPPDFYAARTACLARLATAKDATYKPVLRSVPHARPIPEDRFDEIDTLLGVMADLHSKRDTRAYDQVHLLLDEAVGVSQVEVLMIPANEIVELSEVDGHREFDPTRQTGEQPS